MLCSVCSTQRKDKSKLHHHDFSRRRRTTLGVGPKGAFTARLILKQQYKLPASAMPLLQIPTKGQRKEEPCPVNRRTDGSAGIRVPVFSGKSVLFCFHIPRNRPSVKTDCLLKTSDKKAIKGGQSGK